MNPSSLRHHKAANVAPLVVGGLKMLKAADNCLKKLSKSTDLPGLQRTRPFGKQDYLAVLRAAAIKRGEYHQKS